MAGSLKIGPQSYHKNKGLIAMYNEDMWVSLSEGLEKGGKLRINQISRKSCQGRVEFPFQTGLNSYVAGGRAWRYRYFESKAEDDYIHGPHLVASASYTRTLEKIVPALTRPLQRGSSQRCWC